VAACLQTTCDDYSRADGFNTVIEQVAQPIAYSFDSLASNSMKSSNPHSGCREVETSKTIDTTTPEPSKNQGGIAIAQPVHAFKVRGGCEGRGKGYLGEDEKAFTISAMQDQHIAQPIAVDTYNYTTNEHTTQTIRSQCDTEHIGAVLQTMAIRRLTPKECERLQGFPDDWTKIPYRNKPADQCPDGPRYKACGNSMAVPVMRWIGQRIEYVESLMKDL
jgi:DNA (cytosine-5)-methyltransferase 1